MQCQVTSRSTEYFAAMKGFLHVFLHGKTSASFDHIVQETNVKQALTIEEVDVPPDAVMHFLTYLCQRRSHQRRCAEKHCTESHSKIQFRQTFCKQ